MTSFCGIPSGLRFKVSQTLLSAGVRTHMYVMQSVVDIRAFSVIHLGVVLYVYWPHVDF